MNHGFSDGDLEGKGIKARIARECLADGGNG
jgi:hypothetical protein